MGIAVTQKKIGLEENHAGIPDGGRSSEKGENHTGDQGFHQEKKGGVHKKGN